jgi:hypothetical protein
MNDILPQILPEPEKFRRLTATQRRACLEEALGTFLDSLQVEGRDPRDFEATRFQNALEALGEGNLDQAYEDALALQLHAPAQAEGLAISGQPLSRDEMATGLRHLLDRLREDRAAGAGATPQIRSSRHPL